MNITPPFSPDADAALAGQGYAVLSPEHLLRWSGTAAADWHDLHRSWDALPPDAHLRDGGRYRRRQHGCWTVAPGPQAQHRIRPVPHRAHWQPVAYNALHGGLERWFEPLPAHWQSHPAWWPFLQRLADTASALRGAQTWYAEAHAFRIDTAEGIGRPTPEGAHRDGVDLVAVLLLARAGIKGGETRVFEADGPSGQRFTLSEPLSLLLLDDARVIHEATPIQPLRAEHPGHRDTLVVTLRAGGFQDP